MKIRFKNLGSIEKAELKLNDLTIIAGNNNTGKTYITYSLYGLLKHWKNFASIPEKDKLAAQLRKQGSIKIDIQKLNSRKIEIIKGITERFSTQLHDIFSTQKSYFSKAEISVELKNQNFPRPFILSAERLGISLFYKELDIAKNLLTEQLQKMSSESNSLKAHPLNPFELIEKFSSRYALPIRDNIFFTRDISNVQKKQSDFPELSDKIKEMMGGHFKQRSKEIYFISKARKKGKFDIPLYLSSSSARGLADLYFFLKHEAKKGQLLMIDEPESHLSPANQILMARLLARCVNSGLKIFISTHSDYLIKEFNNLIMLGNEFKGKAEFLKSKKNPYSKSDYLKMESVSAYICENGGLTTCNIDQKGMDIHSFDNTIDEINRISDDLDFLTDSIIEN
ncbi:AAA domain-containing protein [Candidatus Magnetomoraceae bacterium gMMP-15]